MKVGLKARLDKKTGHRAVCGRMDCGADIAIVVECRVSEEFVEEPVDTGFRLRVLCFEPGWIQRRDGVWQLSAHSQRSLRRLDSGKVSRARMLGRRGGTSVEGRRVHCLVRPALPARAKCPRCGFIQTLDAQRLRSSNPLAPLYWAAVESPPKWKDWTLQPVPADFDVELRDTRLLESEYYSGADFWREFSRALRD